MSSCFVEYAISSGKGTLVQHGVTNANKAPHIDVSKAWFIAQRINKREYNDFIAIHGSERAI